MTLRHKFVYAKNEPFRTPDSAASWSLNASPEYMRRSARMSVLPSG